MVLVLSVALVASCSLGGGSSSKGDGSPEVSEALAALDSSPETFPQVVELVASDGLSEEDARLLAGSLGDHLDALAASAGGDGSIERPDAVRFFAALIATGEEAAVADALSGWIVTTVEPFVGTDAHVDAITDALDPLVAVVAAAADGAEHADSDTTASELEGIVTQQAREDLAILVADASGAPPPAPGEQALSLIDAFGGDPVRHIDVESTQQHERLDADDPWPTAG